MLFVVVELDWIAFKNKPKRIINQNLNSGFLRLTGFTNLNELKKVYDLFVRVTSVDSMKSY